VDLTLRRRGALGRPNIRHPVDAAFLRARLRRFLQAGGWRIVTAGNLPRRVRVAAVPAMNLSIAAVEWRRLRPSPADWSAALATMLV
jgi:hypothetical protein